MLIKVCGMRSSKQVERIQNHTDYLGFIFYEKSPRFVEATPDVQGAKKIGVFVNADYEEINEAISKHALDAVQLHGKETPELCSRLASSTQVIKAFGVDSHFSFDKTSEYEKVVDFFLFDTRTPSHGGSGKQFDWSILSNYNGETPFILSGGLQPNSIEAIRQFQHPKFVGIDLNSGFEHSPGDKDISRIKQFIEQIKH